MPGEVKRWGLSASVPTQMMALPHGDYVLYTDHLAALESARAGLEGLRRVECDSCGGDFWSVPSDAVCRGCGATVCQSCTDVFDHCGDGLHGKGDPTEEVKRLRTALAESEERVAAATALMVRNGDERDVALLALGDITEDDVRLNPSSAADIDRELARRRSAAETTDNQGENQ